HLGVAQRRVDPALHRLQILDRREVEITAVDERLELGEEALPERLLAADGPGLQPCGALPRMAERLVVGDRRRQRDRERPLAAARAEPQVDPEGEAVLR